MALPSLTAPQRRLLERAELLGWLDAPALDERKTCLEMTRRGWLQIALRHGDTGYAITAEGAAMLHPAER